MENFLYGVLTAGNLGAAAFFLRFYIRTKQRLLLLFALAFLLFAMNQAISWAWTSPSLRNRRTPTC